MNSLLLFPNEVHKRNSAKLLGKRALEIAARDNLSLGNLIKVSVLNDRRGVGEVTKINDQEIELKLRLDLDPLPRMNSILIVAVPRPQTVKKVIHLATTFGVNELHFIRTENVEKSYLKASTLERESIEHEIYLALEQCYDSIPPLVEIHPRFKPFIEDRLGEMLSKMPNCQKLVAHTSKGAALQPSGLLHNAPSVIAVGAESGWNEYEINLLTKAGFNTLYLGARMLRVEIATAAILGAIS